MRTKHLFVLIHIRNKGEVNKFKHSENIFYFYCTFQGGASFMDLFCYLCFVFVMLSCLFIAVNAVTCWERANLLALLCVMCPCFCHFPMWCPGSGVVLDCIDSLALPSYLFTL